MTREQIIAEINFIKEFVNTNTNNGIAFDYEKVWGRYNELAAMLKNA